MIHITKDASSFEFLITLCNKRLNFNSSIEWGNEEWANSVHCRNYIPRPQAVAGEISLGKDFVEFCGIYPTCARCKELFMLYEISSSTE